MHFKNMSEGSDGMLIVMSQKNSIGLSFFFPFCCLSELNLTVLKFFVVFL